MTGAAIDGTRRGLIVLGAVALALLAVSGCMFRKLHRQQTQIDALCLISGTVDGTDTGTQPRIVLLLRHAPAAADAQWQLIDHFVSEGNGRWLMAAPPGTYALAAFQDRSRDLIYQPGEPLLNAPAADIVCRTGSRINNLKLHIPPDGGHAFAHEVDILGLRARDPAEQLAVTASSVTMMGRVTSLDDARFSDDNVDAGIWAPYDFLLNAGIGVYFLEPYDPARTPVLFVHGIDGSPRDFRYLISRLDRRRFQPWVYYYPSGAHLDRIATHLEQTMLQLELAHGVRSFIVVAHSMGGLVAREFLLLHQRNRGEARVPVFVTLSTPWAGQSSAHAGVVLAPTVVRSWFDVEPGSRFLTGLFQTPDHQRRRLGSSTAHHLVFSFHKNGDAFGESGDGVVTVASELRAQAQAEAASVRGFDDTHTGILQDAAVAEYLSGLLTRTDR